MLEAGISMGLTTAFNAGLYYANSKVFGVGNPKAAAIYSATNTVVSQVATAATIVGLATIIPAAVDDFKIDSTNALPALILGAGLITATAAIAAITTGIVSGIFGGKKTCQWSGNPITAKQIVALALIYGVESAVLFK